MLRNFEVQRCEKNGRFETTATVQKRQQMGDTCLFHFALSEVDPEHGAEGDAQGDSEDDIGEDLAVGAFHGVSLSYRLDGAEAPRGV